jgi:hypothetical protein
MDTAVGPAGVDRLRPATYVVVGIALATAAAAGLADLRLALLPLAVLLGWSHLNSV